MKSKLTPPVHEVKYAETMKSLVSKHLKSMQVVTDEFDVFVNKTIDIVASEAPEFAKPFYETLSTLHIQLSKSFKSFCEKLAPILRGADSIIARREKTRDALKEYQDRLYTVRTKGETEKNVEEEKKALLKFAQELEEMNRDSNDFVLAFLTLYLACSAQMIVELRPMEEAVAGMINNPDEPEMSKEEKELEELIKELESEVAELDRKNAEAAAGKPAPEQKEEEKKEEKKEEEKNEEKKEEEKKEEEKKEEEKKEEEKKEEEKTEEEKEGGEEAQQDDK